MWPRLDPLDAPPVDGVALGERARRPAAPQPGAAEHAVGGSAQAPQDLGLRAVPAAAAEVGLDAPPQLVGGEGRLEHLPVAEHGPAGSEPEAPLRLLGALEAGVLPARLALGDGDVERPAHRLAVRHQRPGQQLADPVVVGHDVVAEPVDERPRDLHVDARHEVQPVRRELRRQHRHAEHPERPVLLLRRDAEHVAVGQHRAAADVERLARRARLAKAADEVAHDVADGDRLAPRRHPRGATIAGRRRVRSRMISNDAEPDPMITAARSSVTGTPAVAQRGAGLLAAAQVLRQLVVRAAQARQVDDPRDAGGRARLGERRRRADVALVEVGARAERVDEVERRVDAGQRRVQRLALEHVAGDGRELRMRTRTRARRACRACGRDRAPRSRRRAAPGSAGRRCSRSLRRRGCAADRSHSSIRCPRLQRPKRSVLGGRVRVRDGAVDEERRAARPRRLVARQVDDRVRDLLRRADAAHRVVDEAPREALRILAEDRAEQRRLDRARDRARCSGCRAGRT